MICDAADDQVYCPAFTQVEQISAPPLSNTNLLPLTIEFPRHTKRVHHQEVLAADKMSKMVRLIGCEGEEQAKSSRSGSICGENTPDGVVHAGAGGTLIVVDASLDTTWNHKIAVAPVRHGRRKLRPRDRGNTSTSTALLSLSLFF